MSKAGYAEGILRSSISEELPLPSHSSAHRAKKAPEFTKKRIRFLFR